jgi:hypothetical protein
MHGQIFIRVWNHTLYFLKQKWSMTLYIVAPLLAYLTIFYQLHDFREKGITLQ